MTEEGLLQLEAWARDGLTDEQIAANIGISRSTLNEWKKKYSDISDTLKRGKEVVDIQVENAQQIGCQLLKKTQVSNAITVAMAERSIIWLFWLP